MADLEKQKKEAKSMEKLKQYLDRIHLKYTERSSDKSTIIKVFPMNTIDHLNNNSNHSEDGEAKQV